MATPEQLAQCFLQTLMPDPTARVAAEAHLKSSSANPGYGIAVLQVVGQPASPPEVRLAAAINFKNHVKYRWAPEADSSDEKPLEDTEKEEIKKYLVTLMLDSAPNVRAQLSEALSLISGHDFPARWQGLLPELNAKMASTTDVAVIEGVLATANSVFKRFRTTYINSQVSAELDYSQKQMAESSLRVFTVLTEQVIKTAPGGDAIGAAALQQLLSAVRYACRIFFSLNKFGLSELAAAQLRDWMSLFHKLLSYENPAAASTDPDRESALDSVKAAVCENLNLVEATEEDDFESYLSTFVTEVWGLLTRLTPAVGQDHLAICAMRFLTTVANSVHWQLFQNEVALKQICEGIIIPSIRMREEDEERFTMDYVEYIRRDTEGNDTDTRRRTASDFVRALRDKMPTDVSTLFSGHVGTMLAAAAADPANAWAEKDCALHLVMTLSVKGETATQGVTAINEFVNIGEFFQNQIMPELAAPASDDTGRCVLQAGALKFVNRFRGQFPKETTLAIFPQLVNALRTESNVVHSYAAIAVERLLSMREAGVPRFTPAELAPQLEPLLTALFGAFKFAESGENEYIMKCTMRLLSFCGSQIVPVAPQCMQELSTMLAVVAKNPTHPGFNHYMFESIAALLKHTAAAAPAQLEGLEGVLMPVFQTILSEDVQEFHPYVFQIFAELITLRPAPLPAMYVGQLFPPLLSGVFWERPGNVPALTPLLSAFLSKAGSEIVAGGHLSPVLGVFQKLLASNVHCGAAFSILETIVEKLPADATKQYMSQIWGMLFQRLQTGKTQKYTRCFVGFVAFFVAQRGLEGTITSMDPVQPGIFWMILQQVWLPNISLVGGIDEFKVCAVGMTRALADAPPAVWQPHGTLWGQMLNACVKYIANQAGQEDAGGANDVSLEEVGFSAAFAKLANAAIGDRQPLPEIKDPKAYLAESLGRLMASTPGMVPGMVEQCLEPEAKAALAATLQAHNVQVA